MNFDLNNYGHLATTTTFDVTRKIVTALRYGAQSIHSFKMRGKMDAAKMMEQKRHQDLLTYYALLQLEQNVRGEWAKPVGS